MSKVNVVYTGNKEGFFICQHDLTVKRGVPVMMEKELFEERKKCDPGNWEIVETKKEKRGGD